MNVVNYLKTNSLDRLKSEYSLRVKQYPDEGLIVLNYMSSSKDSLILNECSSLILSTDYEVISRSFDRFFNYNESDNVLHNDGECYATEKIDGSLIKIYRFNDKWCVSTRGTAFAECCVTHTNITYKQAVFEALGLIDAADDITELAEEQFQQFCRDSSMNSEYTYIFEMTGKTNQIVTVYNPQKYELWLLGVRSNDADGKYIDVSNVNLSDKILRPKRFMFANLAECIESANNLQDLQEGFVVYDQITFAPTLKVKSPTYVHVHGFGSSGSIIDKDICRMIVNGDWTEFLAYCPHHKPKFDEYFDTIDKYFATTQVEYEKLCESVISEQDFHIFEKKPWKALAISIYKQKGSNLREAFSKWDETKQLTFLLKEVIRSQ